MQNYPIVPGTALSMNEVIAEPSSRIVLGVESPAKGNGRERLKPGCIGLHAFQAI